MAQIQIVDVLADIAQICRTAPTPTMVGAYVRAARRFCSRSKWLQVKVLGNTVVGQELYALGSDTYNEIVGIKAASITESVDDINDLTESYSGSWDPTDDPGLPELYQYVPEAQFALHPLPDAIYPLTINVAVQPKRGSNSVDETLLFNWEYELQDGALAYLLNLPGMPWTDKAEAAVREAKFRVAMSSAGINADRGYNPGAAVTQKPGGPSGQVRTKILPI